MNSTWAFLDPWLSVLDEFLLPESKPRGHDWDVMLCFKCSYESEKRLRMHDLSLKLSLNETCRQDRAKLQRLREAMELFTMLAFVDNEALRELLHVDTWFHDFIRPYDRDQKQFYPEWLLYLVETPSAGDIAATQTPISWGTLLGFPEDPRENSPEFQTAMHALEAMGVEESIKGHPSQFAITWIIGRFGRTEVEGTQTSIVPADSPNPFSTQFCKLLGGLVPPVVQMRAVRDSVSIVQQADFPHSNLEVVLTLPGKDMDIPERTICERTLSLARTPTTKFTLGLDRGNLTSKIAVDVGFQLSTLLCNHPVAGATWSPQALQPVSRSVEYEELELKCMAHGPGVPAICSAIAELSLAAKELNFSAVEPTSEAAWSWLAYALFCGSSSIGVDSVEIQRARLTYADVLAVRDVVLNKYPKPLSVQKLDQKPDYGFVYLRAGAKLWLNDCKRDEGPQLVTSAPGRYRAVKNPTHESGQVEVVVPGYGICTTQLEDDEKDKFVTSDGAPFVDDLVQRTSFLTMWLATVENDTVVTKLLTLIGWGLKSLKLIKTNTELLRRTVTRENQAQLELSLLAEACPCLRDVVVAGFNVTVAADSEALGN